MRKSPKTGDRMKFTALAGGRQVTVTKITHGGSRVHYTDDETGQAGHARPIELLPADWQPLGR